MTLVVRRVLLALAWTAFNLLHLVYHVTMLQVSLVILLLVSASLLTPARRGLSPG